jgi:hypothetical protein
MAVMTCAPALAGAEHEEPGRDGSVERGLRGEMSELGGEMRGMLPRLYAADLLGIMGAAGLMLAAASIA